MLGLSFLTANGPADAQTSSSSCFSCSGRCEGQICQNVCHPGVLQLLDDQCNPHHMLISSVPGPRGGWMGYADPPVCPAALSQLHASSLKVVGFVVRQLSRERGRAARPPQLPSCPRDGAHGLCWAPAGALETYTLFPWTPHCAYLHRLFV